jgi:hypothetical protein
VDLGECCRQANGDTQDASRIEQLAPLKNQIKGLTARVHEYVREYAGPAFFGLTRVPSGIALMTSAHEPVGK